MILIFDLDLLRKIERRSRSLYFVKTKNIVGIILAVPAQYHSEMAIKAMDSKKHVFVEKPLAMNVDEAKSMIESSKRNKVSLMVGHLLQYHSAFIKLKKFKGKNKKSHDFLAHLPTR